MINKGTEIYVQDQPWALNLGVWLVHRNEDGRKFIAPPVVFVQMEEGVQTAPSLTLDHEAAQDLMNRLWQMGIRPRDGEGTMAHVGAMKEHIADLRKVAFSHHDTSVPDRRLNLEVVR
jgi:hypothetical protein